MDNGESKKVFDMPIKVEPADEIARKSMQAKQIEIIGGLCFAIKDGHIYVSEQLVK